jgi:uncharacterized damage-inducible protein DinB
MNRVANFKENCILRLHENNSRIIACFDQLSEEEVWLKPVAAGNSMANLVLHLTGNITQYILSPLGGMPDHRVREEEFSKSGGFNKEELLQIISGTIEKAASIIDAVDTEKLLKIYHVQGFRLSGMGIIIHVVEHLSYHTGQIALHTKMLRNTDLGFYKGMNLNVKNEQEL